MKLSVMKLKQDLPPCLLQKEARELDKNQTNPIKFLSPPLPGLAGQAETSPSRLGAGQHVWLWDLWCLSERLQSSVQVAAEDRQRLQVPLRLGSAWWWLLPPLEAAPCSPALSSPARWLQPPRNTSCWRWERFPAPSPGSGFFPAALFKCLKERVSGFGGLELCPAAPWCRWRSRRGGPATLQCLRSPASSPGCSFLLCRPRLVFLELLPSKDQPGRAGGLPALG